MYKNGQIINFFLVSNESVSNDMFFLHIFPNRLDIVSNNTTETLCSFRLFHLRVSRLFMFGACLRIVFLWGFFRSQILTTLFWMSCKMELNTISFSSCFMYFCWVVAELLKEEYDQILLKHTVHVCRCVALPLDGTTVMAKAVRGFVSLRLHLFLAQHFILF